MQRWEQQLQKEIDLLSTYHSHIQTDRNLNIIIERYHAILKRIKSLKESYVIEMNMLKNRSERKEYESKLQVKVKRIKEISEKIEKMIETRQKSGLLTSSSSSSSKSGQITGGGQEEDDIELQLQPMNNEILAETKSVQNDTKYSIARSQDLVQHSTLVGHATMETLYEQRKQITKVESSVLKIDSKMDQSSNLVAEYLYFIGSDRIFQFFTVLNSLLVIIIIIYLLTSNKR